MAYVTVQLYVMSAQDPLKMVAAEPQLLPFRDIESHFHDQVDLSHDP